MSGSKSLINPHFAMKLTSIALFFLIPAFIFTFGSIIGEDHEAVVEYLSKPLPRADCRTYVNYWFAAFSIRRSNPN